MHIPSYSYHKTLIKHFLKCIYNIVKAFEKCLYNTRKISLQSIFLVQPAFLGAGL